MKHAFFKRRCKSLKDGTYVVEIKYCDWSKDCDICLARYTNKSYFIWILGEDDKVIKEKDTVIKLLVKAKENNKNVPKGLIRRIKDA